MSGYNLVRLGYSLATLDCNLVMLDCRMAKLVSTQASSNSLLETLDYNLVTSDCMLVILENILVIPLVYNLNILQLVVHRMVTTVQMAVENCQDLSWFKNYFKHLNNFWNYFSNQPRHIW